MAYSGAAHTGVAKAFSASRSGAHGLPSSMNSFPYYFGTLLISNTMSVSAKMWSLPTPDEILALSRLLWQF